LRDGPEAGIVRGDGSVREPPLEAWQTVIIPYQELSPAALRGVIEDVVTRDGTELSDAEVMIGQVMRQLELGKVVITYDPQTRTCNLRPAAEAIRNEGGQDG
jgi:uncharacterized protein YheU (UPF0270 family)